MKSSVKTILILKFILLSFVLCSCTAFPLSDDDPPENILVLLIDNQSSIELYERRQGSNGQERFVLIPNFTPTPIWTVGFGGEIVPQIDDLFTNENSENGSFIYARNDDGNLTEALRWTDSNLDWELVAEGDNSFSYILEVNDEMLE